MVRSRKRIGLSVAAGAIALALGSLAVPPQALKSAPPNSAAGSGQTYHEALADFAASLDTATGTAAGTTTEFQLAAILARAADGPLTGEQVIALHEKLIAVDLELAALSKATITHPDGTTTTTNALTDPDFADVLAEQANEIRAMEASQGLGNGDALADATDAVDDL
jgi:hypothetical protein